MEDGGPLRVRVRLYVKLIVTVEPRFSLWPRVLVQFSKRYTVLLSKLRLGGRGHRAGTAAVLAMGIGVFRRGSQNLPKELSVNS